MEYYLFIDECGDANIDKVEAHFPYFATCGILVSKYNYQEIDNRLRAVKYKFWGDKTVIFRSYYIRKDMYEFSIFKGRLAYKQELVECINSLVVESRYKIICPVIHKPEYREKYTYNAFGAYETALTFLLQKSIYCLNRQPTATPKTLDIILEKRGEPLDTQIKQYIMRLMAYGFPPYNTPADFSKYIRSIDFQPKYADISGLQLADLMAYPIVTKVQHPDRPNLSYNYLSGKLDHKDGIVDGYGIIRFPKIEKPEIIGLSTPSKA
ncbi:MAG: DUF3800 domain-containing protein [Bacteroidetes bacterium]|nr:DUF3800 domain-containing protein [Bacteroidota bacterium]